MPYVIFLSSYFFFSRMHVSYFVCVFANSIKKTVTKKKKVNGCFGNMKQPKNIGPMREGLKSWSAKRKLVLESATNENEPPPKCQRRAAKVKCNSSSIALVYMKSLNRIRKSVNINCM